MPALLHDQLLAQAHHLLERDTGLRRADQANLRRATSTAYYALFHLLIREATDLILPRRQDAGLRAVVARAVTHADLLAVAKSASGGNLGGLFTAVTSATGLPADLKLVASSAMELQKARHEADYNTARHISRREAKESVAQADRAFAAWQRVRATAGARVVLVALLVGKRTENR